MKPAPFDYVRVGSIADATAALATDDDAKVIAGGQSLAPLMALRLARPTLLVDVNDAGLDGCFVADGVVHLGATVRHRFLENDPVVVRDAPLLAQAAALIGHPAIRVRGTLGGSVAHADPAAELPAALIALSAEVVVRGTDDERIIPAGELFEGFLTTAIEPDELLVEVRVPVAGAHEGAAWCEWAPRRGDFAVAGIAVVVDRDDDGTVRKARSAGCGLAGTPVDLHDALAPVVGERSADDALLREIAGRVRAAVRPPDDRVASGDDRVELAGLLAARALARAMDRSGDNVTARAA